MFNHLFIMLSHFNRILVLAPHTDDAELGCGGTIAKLADSGKDIFVVALSPAKESLPPELHPDTLKIEYKNSLNVLGIADSNIECHDYPVRRLNDYRQDILELFVRLRNSYKPDLVIATSTNDVHQDHQVVAMESRRAFKFSSIINYELPWNHFDFSVQMLSELDESHLAKKLRALDQYLSQKRLNRPYFTEAYTRSVATLRGIQCGRKYAEAFEVTRLIS